MKKKTFIFYRVLGSMLNAEYLMGSPVWEADVKQRTTQINVRLQTGSALQIKSLGSMVDSNSGDGVGTEGISEEEIFE